MGVALLEVCEVFQIGACYCALEELDEEPGEELGEELDEEMKRLMSGTLSSLIKKETEGGLALKQVSEIQCWESQVVVEARVLCKEDIKCR